MLTNNLPLRITGVTVLMSCLLLALCIAAIFVLAYQQATSAGNLDEDVNSSQVAHEMESTLHDLVALHKAGNKKVEPLHARVEGQLRRARKLADKPEEIALVTTMEEGFHAYLASWNDRGPDRPKDPQAAVVGILRERIIAPCNSLQLFNVQQIKESAASHHETVRTVVIGLIAVGIVGALAGLLLGYGVARGLRRSIYTLRVHVQDATNKLAQDLPTVAVTDDGDLHSLHDQMQGVVRDIQQVVTKLHQREREVLRAEQLATVGQLAAGVAHEIRNPLTSIKMLVQANREEAASRGVPAEDLAVIELEIRRMERCLQYFLDFARPPKPERRPLLLAQPIERTLALIAGRARKQQVEVSCTHADPNLEIFADAEQMQQLLLNLLLNALDAMPHGGRLEVHVADPINQIVELQVRDTGTGISADVLQRLFKPFVSDKETGLGLGLVTAQRIAESHGGTLQGRNRSEGGACFVVRLPVPERLLADQGRQRTAGLVPAG